MTEKNLQVAARYKLLQEGWAVWFPPRTWGERDIFGVFDFIAAKGKKIILVQITTKSHISHRRKKIQDFLDANLTYFPGIQIWAWDLKAELFKIIKM